MNSANPADRVICAIDTDDLATGDSARQSTLLDRSAPSNLVWSSTPRTVRPASRRSPKNGMPIFLDLKFSDIPNTVAGAMRAAAGACAPAMVTVHATGGPAMMRAAAAAGMRIADATGGDAGRRYWAVTVLTSFDDG